MKIMLRLGAISVCMVLVAGCANSNDGDASHHHASTGAPDQEGVEPSERATQSADVGHESIPTYHGTIKGVIALRCAGCHADGAGAPFVMDTYAATKTMAKAALNSIEAGRMPPWMPDPNCRNYKSQRLIEPEEVAAFKAWVEADMPEGDPDGPQVVAPVLAGPLDDLGPPDFVARYPEVYVPNTETPDDYRCFPLDVTFDEPTFIRGTRIVPDQIAQVHHVLVFVINPGDVAELEQRDADEAGPGYTCFGGPGVGQNFGQIAGWAPGGLPSVSDPGYARYVPQGSRLVMQVHYNVLAGDPVPDQTAIELYAYGGEQEMLLRTVPQANLSIQIPAGDKKSVHVKEFKVRGESITVLGTAPHMHQLGARIRVDLVRKNGEEECLVDIKAWDFNWQQVYRFLDDESIVAHDGDAFRLTCEYDNSEANQPVVNGEQLMPRNVRWGDGTFDEMCLNYITVAEPYEPPAAQCGELAACRESCVADDNFGCLTNCLSTDQSCSQCVLLDMVQPGGCMRDGCGTQLGEIAGCFRNCATQLIAGGDLSLCFDSECPEEYAALAACMNPVLKDGRCESIVDKCTE
ncbi:MAG: hypothetical protein VX589_02910 [Myxococcota bacterium]|nr:hypothetical protein [Myxococcota bacterium]